MDSSIESESEPSSFEQSDVTDYEKMHRRSMITLDDLGEDSEYSLQNITPEPARNNRARGMAVISTPCNDLPTVSRAVGSSEHESSEDGYSFSAAEKNCTNQRESSEEESANDNTATNRICTCNQINSFTNGIPEHYPRSEHFTLPTRDFDNQAQLPDQSYQNPINVVYSQGRPLGVSAEESALADSQQRTSDRNLLVITLRLRGPDEVPSYPHAYLQPNPAIIAPYAVDVNYMPYVGSENYAEPVVTPDRTAHMPQQQQCPMQFITYARPNAAEYGGQREMHATYHNGPVVGEGPQYYNQPAYNQNMPRYNVGVPYGQTYREPTRFYQPNDVSDTAYLGRIPHSGRPPRSRRPTPYDEPVYRDSPLQNRSRSRRHRRIVQRPDSRELTIPLENLEQFGIGGQHSDQAYDNITPPYVFEEMSRRDIDDLYYNNDYYPNNSRYYNERN